MEDGPILRVLFITRKWRPAVGGMETYCHELTAELEDRVELTVEALPGRPDGGRPSVLGNAGFGLRMLWYLLRRAGRFDVIHVADMAIWPLALAGGLRNRRAILVASAHGTDIAYPRRPGLRPFLYGLYLRLGSRILPRMRVIANSRATAGLCAEAGFAAPAVVRLGTRATIGDEKEYRAGTERYVLYVGRLVARKGCGWFIREVLPLLDDDIRIRVAGTVWDEAEGRSLDDPRVDFLGPVFGEELGRLRRRAIVVVLPNIQSSQGEFEGFGLTALEAAADGGVLCAASIDGVVDAVRDTETGFLLPPADGRIWADRISGIARWSPGERAEFTEHARTVVAADYSWARVAAETLEVYRRDGEAAKERGQ